MYQHSIYSNRREIDIDIVWFWNGMLFCQQIWSYYHTEIHSLNPFPADLPETLMFI